MSYCALWPLFILTATAFPVNAQVNSGSDGSDGALNPTENITINMADHPDGIYHYSSVNIPAGVTVSFIPNAANTPVFWLVQTSATISGTITLRGESSIADNRTPVRGGAGGFGSGAGPISGGLPGAGRGPGGGKVDPLQTRYRGGNGSYRTVGSVGSSTHPAGDVYGNHYLIPLIGGSGGGGGVGTQTGYPDKYTAGSGGGGAILIAANDSINLLGTIDIRGGVPGSGGGTGSGGAIRLVATVVSGNGSLNEGNGRTRIDALSDTFNGNASSRGYQPIIFLPENQNVSLSITEVGGLPVTQTPVGSPTSPDLVIPTGVSNPMSIVVKCVNLPLDTEVIFEVKPANGDVIRATALNQTGNSSLSYATAQVTMPTGAGTIQAKAVTGIASQLAAAGTENNSSSLAKTGWLATGERFAAVEVTTSLGGSQSLAYISTSGQRFVVGGSPSGN